MSFIDTIGVPEFFAESLLRVEHVGPNRRLVFTISQPNGTGGFDISAVVKVVLSSEAAASAGAMLLDDTSERLTSASMRMSAAN